MHANDAPEFKLGSLTIAHPWARPTDKMAETGAAYFTIRNEGSAADRLIAAATDAAAAAELHTTVNKDGMLSMKHIAAIDVPANGSTMLRPGVFHVMLVHLKAPLHVGQHFALHLTFAKAGQVTVQVGVEQPTADTGEMKMDMGGQEGGMKK